MQYQGWNFEKTLLIRSAAGRRCGDLIDVGIPLDPRSAGNLQRDIRVVLKKDWNLLDREIPSQVYDIRHHAGVTTCRVAFVMDVPAGQPQRVGIFYDNPSAPAPVYQSPLEMTGGPLGGTVKTPFLTAVFDERSGQLKTLTGRFDIPSGDPLYVPCFDRVQDHAAVTFAVQDAAGNCRAEYASPVQWDKPEITEDIRGPVFIKLTRQAKLSWPNCPSPDRCPTCRITYKFFARQPHFLVNTRLAFPEDIDVFAVQIGTLSASADRWTHYTFRPVSPNLPETEVEEMGHILIDPQHTGGLPVGPVFSDLLPYDLPWQAFIRVKKNPEAGLAAVQLRHSVTTPAGPFPYYRHATHLLRHPDGVSFTRAAIHVKNHRPENIVTIPAGTALENLDAILCDRFDMNWGTRTDALGKHLNNPPEIAAHPRFMLGQVPPEDYEPLPYGQRSDAYRRHGVR